MDIATNINDKLLALLHVDTGSPPRGSEATTLTIRNTTTQQSSIAFVGQTMVIVQRYVKTLHLPKQGNFDVSLL
jgi:hypothetical protein